MASQPRPPGRPRTSRKPGFRSTLSLRVTAEIYDRLATAASAKGDTLSREAELRLDQSFRDEDRAELFHDAVYGRQLAGLLEALGQAARFALPDRTANDWLADDEACARVVGAIQEVLAALCGATYAPDGAELSGAGIARATTLSPIADNRPTTILTGELDRFGRAARAKLGEVAAARICDRLRRPPFVQPDEESR